MRVGKRLPAKSVPSVRERCFTHASFVVSRFMILPRAANDAKGCAIKIARAKDTFVSVANLLVVRRFHLRQPRVRS
jgi:hypothetical protein